LIESRLRPAHERKLLEQSDGEWTNGHHRKASLRRSRDSRGFVLAAGYKERTLDPGGDHTGFELGLHRQHGRKRGPPGAAIGATGTQADVQWVVESYALFLAALLLIGGVLGDLYGRRKVFAAFSTDALGHGAVQRTGH
jgi:hypothetical protein